MNNICNELEEPRNSEIAPIDIVLRALREKGCRPRQTGTNKWAALCPAHNDSSPSLSVSTGKDGRALLHCHAGDNLTSITNALGISISDLFVKRGSASA